MVESVILCVHNLYFLIYLDHLYIINNIIRVEPSTCSELCFRLRYKKTNILTEMALNWCKCCYAIVYWKKNDQNLRTALKSCKEIWNFTLHSLVAYRWVCSCYGCTPGEHSFCLQIAVPVGSDWMTKQGSETFMFWNS